MPDDTLLLISGIGIAPYSARGLKQTLRPIDAAKAGIVRAASGRLLDLSVPQLRKYRSEITCEDINAPAIGSVWPGMALTIDCVAEIPFPSDTGAPDRTVVEGSLRTEGAYSFYRPRLDMRVIDFELRIDEYKHVVGWQLLTEED